MAGEGAPAADGMTSARALAEVLEVFQANRSGRPVGVYSVCTAHPLALDDVPGVVYEAHSTNYQPAESYRAMRGVRRFSASAGQQLAQPR